MIKKQIWFIDFSTYRQALDSQTLFLDIGFPMTHTDATLFEKVNRKGYACGYFIGKLYPKDSAEIVQKMIELFLDDAHLEILICAFHDDIAAIAKKRVETEIALYWGTYDVTTYDKNDIPNALPYRLIFLCTKIPKRPDEWNISALKLLKDERLIITKFLPPLDPLELHKRILFKN